MTVHENAKKEKSSLSWSSSLCLISITFTFIQAETYPLNVNADI